MRQIPTPTAYSEKVSIKWLRRWGKAVELVIEAIADNREQFVYEAADLLYHYLILLKVKDLTLEDIEKELKSRSVSK